MDPQPQNLSPETKMEFDSAPETVLLGSDDSSDDDDIMPLPTELTLGATLTSRPKLHSKPASTRVPDVIDLTKDDEMEDESMLTENLDNSVQQVDDEMPELIEVEPIPATEIAEDRKKKGNDHFKLGEYYQALEMYSQAIAAMPQDAQYYGNRSACYMMLKRYKEALSDIRTSVQLDPKYEKGYLRMIRATLALGNTRECELAFEAAKRSRVEVDAKHEREKLTWLKNHIVEIDSTKVKKDYRKLVFLTSQALDVATADNSLKMTKADALVRLGRHSEAQELCIEVLTNDVRCAEALYIRAMCWYLDDNVEKSIQFVRQGLQYAPDNGSFQTLFKKLKLIKEMRDTGSKKFSTGQFTEAKQDYSQCLKIVSDGEMINITIQSKLFFNLALIALRLHNMDESLTACGKAIELNPNYLKAIIHRARIYTQKEMHDDAIHDYEAAIRIEPSLKDLKKELQNAKMAAKRAKRKDYYKILNVEKNATEDEIKKAYKKRALVHHPDRHASAPEAVQKEQEKLFKDLGEAYEVLSDSKKRFRYDQGVDLMEERGFEAQDNSAHDFLNVFFGSAGYPQFRTQGSSRGHPFHHTYRH